MEKSDHVVEPAKGPRWVKTRPGDSPGSGLHRERYASHVTDLQGLVSGSLDTWRTVHAEGRCWSEPGQRLTEGLTWCWRRQGVEIDSYEDQDLAAPSSAETRWELWAEQDPEVPMPP